ncbi:hypothetical protein RJ639_017660 [Escallonia herrerae]|uniref:RRM domain-containing protein n=1 Tax=Escallonia herrerae TaxID=1293975 RepID=A0AA89AKS5_9ASTE|nr:hypothetical protein RJ639_017660 [Escallonia herrerae]
MDHQEHAVKGLEVFVGGLSRNVSEEKIREVFSTCGEVKEVRLIKDQKGTLKGFCFVRFATKEAAEFAVKEKSGLVLDGKQIGVLPSADQDTLFLGNLYKGWSVEDFDKIVRRVFPDVVSVDLALPSNSGETPIGQKKQNRGFAFVKFSSHAAAARAYRAGSKAEFLLDGNLHPAVQWADEEPVVDPKELAKVKIGFIRNLPAGADERYLKKLFMPFGKVEKVVLSKKSSSSVGFIHFANRSDLDDAIKELNDKTIPGPNGGLPYIIQVEVARPIDKSRKRAREEPQSKQASKMSSHSKILGDGPSFSSPGFHSSVAHKEVVLADPYEAAVVSLPVAVKERLLRILRLGIATRFDIDIHSLATLKELPESTAISVLDQHQVDKLGLHQLPRTLPLVNDIAPEESELSRFSSRVHLPVDSIASHVGVTAARSDSYSSRYSSLYSDYPLSSGAVFRRMEETSTSPLQQFPASSALYGKVGVDSHLTSCVDRQPTRSQVRFDPFTGEPYKFDPFTGEPILPESLPRRYGSPY